ncbi:MAG: cellulase family glycosylhydrolase [Eubacteriales bacterium]|jgi:endoglucanase
MLYENFHNGINLGGWLSQYEYIASQPLNEGNLRQHFSSFITEQNISEIAGWGCDHVRLPVDGNLLYNAETDSLREPVVRRITDCIHWCEKYHLNLVLDLHDIEGNVWGAMDQAMPLLTDRSLRARLIRVWELLTEKLLPIRKPLIMFELLNEVSDASGAYPDDDPTGITWDMSRNPDLLWNRLAADIIAAIRRIDPERYILVGSNGQNNTVYLKELQIINDPHIAYNFHFYDPQVFTHQRADFSEEMSEYNRTVHYPDDIRSFSEYLETHPKYQAKYRLVAHESRNDHALMERLMMPAIRFIRDTGRELYCGEFGVIDGAPVNDAAHWIQDLYVIMDKSKIGHALWNYKYLNFGLIGLDNKPVSGLYKEVFK